MKEPKKTMSSKSTDIVSYALKVSVNGLTCVFEVHFRSSGTFESKVCKLAYQLISMCQNMCDWQ